MAPTSQGKAQPSKALTWTGGPHRDRSGRGGGRGSNSSTSRKYWVQYKSIRVGGLTQKTQIRGSCLIAHRSSTHSFFIHWNPFNQITLVSPHGCFCRFEANDINEDPPIGVMLSNLESGHITLLLRAALETLLSVIFSFCLHFRARCGYVVWFL